MRDGSDEQATRAIASLPIGEESEFRWRLRELQWQLPLSIQGPLLRLLGRRYNPYSEWHRENQAIFVHIPRTAGTSFALAAGPPKQHVPLSRYAVCDPTAFSDYFKFCFVRNPWDRALSAYSIMNAAKADKRWPDGRLWSRKYLSDYPTFEGFVLALQDRTVRAPIMAYPQFRPQLDWLTLPRSTKVEIDFVGRFETLTEDYSIVARRLGLYEPLPTGNASEHQPYREAYSTKMRAIVADLYAADIDAFDYSF
jgi:sulfotransferase famil protein